MELCMAPSPIHPLEYSKIFKADKYEVEELKKSIDRKSFTAWRWANWIPAAVLVILTIINMVN